MLLCPSCNHENPDSLEFCLNCAGTLQRQCPACAQRVPATFKFCSQCGSSLNPAPAAPAAPPAPHDEPLLQSLRSLMPEALSRKIQAVAKQELLGERREISVLFLDIVNYTRTTHALDSEDAYLLTERALRPLASVVYKYEGTIDKFTGDGLMALFGAPVTHENDPERAVRAALDMLDALRPVKAELMAKHGINLQVRIGINTGLVIAGQIGSDNHMEYTVVGDTANLGSRLESAAEPDTILVSFSTYQRTRALFRYQAMPAFVPKGFPEAIKPYRPLGLRALPDPLRGLPGLRVPMVGRQEALAQLTQAFTTMRSSQQSHIALVTGEAGMGKSRLVTELLNAVAAEKVRVFQGSCLSFARSSPLWVLADALRNIIEVKDTDLAATQVQALRRYVDKLKSDGLLKSNILPYLMNVLGLEQADPVVEASLRLLDPTMLQRQTHAALRQLFVTGARRESLILVLEDLHWMDDASRAFLEYFVQSIQDVPLLLVLICRELEGETVIRPMLSNAAIPARAITDIPLQRLSQRESAQLVDRLLGDSKEDIARLKQQIVARTEGNPFYMEELIRMLLDHEAILEREQGWEITPQAIELLEEIPGTVKGLLLARFDKLPDSTRQILQRAAVLGRSFPITLLQLFVDGPIEQELEQLEKRHFLVAGHDRGEARYAFRHVLIQQAIYDTLLHRDRRTLHGRLAGAIEANGFWQPEEQAEWLAYHYVRSETPARAVPYLVLAAERAERRYANSTALEHYQEALTWLDEAAASDPTLRYRIHLGLGRTLKFTGRYPEALQSLLLAFDHLKAAERSDAWLDAYIDTLRELADVRLREGEYKEAIAYLSTGLVELESSAAPSSATHIRSLLDRMAWVHFRQGELERAHELATTVVSKLNPDTLDAPTTLASLYNTLGGIHWQRGDTAAALHYVEQSLQLHTRLGYWWGMAVTYTNLGNLYYKQGQWRNAHAALERALDIEQQNGYLSLRPIILNNLATLRLSLGVHKQAQQDFEQCLTVSEQIGEGALIVASHIGLARLALLYKQIPVAFRHIEQARSTDNSAGANERAELMVLEALAFSLSHRLEMALERALEAVEMARQGSFSEPELDGLQVLGTVYGMRAEWALAEEALRKAVLLSHERKDVYRRSQTLTKLASLFMLQRAESTPRAPDGLIEQTRDALTTAAKGFNQLGAKYDLEMVRRLLQQLEQESAPPATLHELPEGEWHLATIAWVRLLPPEQADGEALFEALSLLRPLLIQIAEWHQGQVVTRKDGLTVIFGAPVTREDDAERAVQCVLNMKEQVEQITPALPVPLTAHFALSQGMVVTGESDASGQRTVALQGPTIDLAQRLAELTPAGQIWVTSRVRNVTNSHFHYSRVQRKTAQLLPELPILALEGIRPKRSYPSEPAGSPTKLIGRDKPLGDLLAHAALLDHSVGGIAALQGHAGIGKSRLLREFVQRLPDTVTVWHGQCLPRRANDAFALLSDLLTNVIGCHPADSPAQVKERLDNTLRAWPEEAREARPYLELLLRVGPTGAAREQLLSMEPDQLRQQLFVALRRLLKNLTDHEGPLVLLLDDLHWLDSMSAAALLFLSSLIRTQPLLLVCAWRPGDAPSTIEPVQQILQLHADRTVAITLERLSLQESEELLSTLLPHANLPATLYRRILGPSEGNPYYIEEFARMLTEGGFLRQEGREWRIPANTTLDELPVPHSLEALIRSRVDALPAAHKRLLQCASVIGGTFDQAMLQQLSGSGPIEPLLSTLATRGLLHPLTQKESHWQFSHILTERTVYGTLLKSHRQALHLRYAQIMETHWQQEARQLVAERAEELAYHYSKAGADARALPYLILSGEQAAARSANQEAINHFQQALRLLERINNVQPLTRWKLFSNLSDAYRAMGKFRESLSALRILEPTAHNELSPLQRVGLFRRLGETYMKAGELEQSARYYLKALKVSPLPRSTRVQAELARVHNGLGWQHFQQGDFDAAEAAARMALQLATEAQGPGEMADAENLLGGIFYRRGQWQEAHDRAHAAMALREKMGYTWGGAASLANLGVLAVAAGEWEKARAYFEHSLQRRSELGDLEGIIIVHNNLGQLALDQGHFEEAEQHFRESISLAQTYAIRYHIANSGIGLSRALLQRGALAQAQQALEQALPNAETLGLQEVRAEGLCIQAELFLAQGRYDEAIALATQVSQIGAEHKLRAVESAARRLLILGETARGRLHAAEQLVATAMQGVDEATDPLEAGRLLLATGRFYVARGDHNAARPHFERARTIFSTLKANWDLRQAEQWLARGSAGAAPRIESGENLKEQSAG